MNDNEEKIATLLALSQQLLDAIDGQDWETYTQLCDPTLTAFEPEAVGNLVRGLPFHQYYFELPSDGRPKQSTISSPNVRLLGETAVVVYVRLVQKLDEAGRPVSFAFEETRIWHQQGGNWRHLHFHRSPVTC